MPNQEKIEIVEQSSQVLKKAVGIYFTKYTGMNVVQATEFRKMCRETNVSYSINKNTLIKIAAKNAGYKDLFDNILEGQISIATSNEDAIAPARIIKDFNKKNDNVLEVVGVFVDGELHDPEKYKILANLPTREELIAKFISMLNQPMTQLVSTLDATMTNLGRALQSLKSKK